MSLMSKLFAPDFPEKDGRDDRLRDTKFVRDGLLRLAGIQRADDAHLLNGELAATCEPSVARASDGFEMGRVKTAPNFAAMVNLVALRDSTDVVLVRPPMNGDRLSVDPGESISVFRAGAVPKPAFRFGARSVERGVWLGSLPGTRRVIHDVFRSSSGATNANRLPAATSAQGRTGRCLDFVVVRARSASSGLAVDWRSAFYAVIGTIDTHVSLLTDVPRPERSNAAGHFVFQEQLYQTGGL